MVQRKERLGMLGDDGIVIDFALFPSFANRVSGACDVSAEWILTNGRTRNPRLREIWRFFLPFGGQDCYSFHTLYSLIPKRLAWLVNLRGRRNGVLIDSTSKSASLQVVSMVF
jgi:hypothetical protein